MATRGRTDWFDVWCADWEGLIETQARNIQSEIEAGWKYKSARVQNEIRILNEFNGEYKMNLGRFGGMTDEEVNRYCYYDLLRRGAISR